MLLGDTSVALTRLYYNTTAPFGVFKRFRLYLKRRSAQTRSVVAGLPYLFVTNLGSHTTDCPIIYVITREQSLTVVLFYLSVKSGSKCSESYSLTHWRQ